MDMNTAALRPIVCPVLIGRTSYLEALIRLMEQACSGYGQTVLIAGEAGMGEMRPHFLDTVTFCSFHKPAAAPPPPGSGMRCFLSARSAPCRPPPSFFCAPFGFP